MKIDDVVRPLDVSYQKDANAAQEAKHRRSTGNILEGAEGIGTKGCTTKNRLTISTQWQWHRGSRLAWPAGIDL